MSTTDLADATPVTGIVWAYRFRPDGGAEAIPPEAVDAALTAYDGGWIWVHLGLADMRCRAGLRAGARTARRTERICGSTSSARRSSAYCPTCIKSSPVPAMIWCGCAS